jgi:transposase-like protein
MDRDGTLLDSLLSKTRDRAALKKFLQPAKEVTGGTPERVTTDGHTRGGERGRWGKISMAWR